VMPMTGALAAGGKQVVAGVRLYMAQHGDVVAGRKLELIVKDEASLPDLSKRVAQELIASEKALILGGGAHSKRAGDRAAGDRGQDNNGRHDGECIDRHRAVALLRAHQLDPRPAGEHPWRLGGEDWVEARDYRFYGLGSGH
jgi:hypothetical protein